MIIDERCINTCETHTIMYKTYPIVKTNIYDLIQRNMFVYWTKYGRT